ncbi:hypothetical protein CASFOL_030033 [Castilleja foliolosa]|uniref:Uncharacterized protein n=1 Tax=Castilleja foliolosa TaxID=1961234 RepID=A0ABD3CAZ5_9LAMI
MYPKVKVRVHRDEDDIYAYEKSSLESLKAFDWLSLHHSSSSDKSPVVRVPPPYAPKSPAPSFRLTPKDANKKKAVVEENRKDVRHSSAPRPRAVLSSPDNDGIIGSKTSTRTKLFSGLKDRPPSQNRHSRCKIFPKSSGSEGFITTIQGYNKESTEPKNEIRAKGRSSIGDSNIRARHHKKITPSSVQC